MQALALIDVPEGDAARGIQLFLIEPGKPNQNTYIESFNGRFRDECLNKDWFTRLQHARVVVESWRREYNEERPKRSLGRLTPAAYAKTLRQNELNYLEIQSPVLLITGGVEPKVYIVLRNALH